MRWLRIAVLVAVGAAAWLAHDYRITRAEERCKALQVEVERLNAFLPTLLRTELSAHERRMIAVLQARGQK